MTQPNCHQHKQHQIPYFQIGILFLLLLISTAESFQVTPSISFSNPSEMGCSRSRHASVARPMSTTDASSSSSVDHSKDDASSPSSKDEYAMPWSDLQNSALRDNLPKYTVRIPLQTSSGSDQQQNQVFCLWRTMLKDLPELAGYPIDFLQEMHWKQLRRNETLLEVTPGILPYLEDYEFATAGGVSGAIFGVAGIADGTRIQTSAVSNVEVTLPQGFVRTTDGSAAYEVGKPKRQEVVDLTSSSSSSSTEALEKGGELLKSVSNTADGAMNKVEEGDAMLARLGASTAILLAGATAVNLLSHHLTVNVFWV